VPLEDAEAGFAGLVPGLAAALQQGGGTGMAAGLDYGDAVEGGVELPVPAPVEALGAVITDATLAALPEILDPGQPGYHDTAAPVESEAVGVLAQPL
jgi:hypothetical protein